MLVTAELRDGDGVALTGTSTRLTWAAAATAVAAVSGKGRCAAAGSGLAAKGGRGAAANVRGAASGRAPPVAVPPPVAVAPPVAMAAAGPSAMPVPPQADVVRSLDSREIAALIKRGQDLLAAATSSRRGCC